MDRETRRRLVMTLGALAHDLNIIEKAAMERGGEGALDYAAIGELLAKRGFMDRDYYKARYPDLATRNMEPAYHYAKYGFREWRAPAEWLERTIQLIPVETACECESPGHFIEILLERALSASWRDGSPAPFRIIRQGAYESLYDLPLHVQWSLTHMCNYRCSYCNYGARGAVDRLQFHPFHKMVNAVENLAALNRPSYEFAILGGEPTIYPHMPELLYHIDSRLAGRVSRITVVTNGSRDPEYFNQFAELARRVYLQIMLSIHTEQVNPRHLYRLAREIDPAIELNYLLMLNPAKLEFCQEIYSALCELRREKAFELTLQTVYEGPEFVKPDSRYPPGIEEWQNTRQQMFNEIARKSSAQAECQRPPSFSPFWEVEQSGRTACYSRCSRAVNFQKGWLNLRDIYCVTGAHILSIHADGSLWRSACNLPPLRLNAYDRDCFKNADFMEIARCPHEACVCSDNDVAMKFADYAEAERFLEAAKRRQERLM